MMHGITFAWSEDAQKQLEYILILHTHIEWLPNILVARNCLQHFS